MALLPSHCPSPACKVESAGHIENHCPPKEGKKPCGWVKCTKCGTMYDRRGHWWNEMKAKWQKDGMI